MGQPKPYQDPVSRLLQIDDPALNTFLQNHPWPDYTEQFGLSPRDVPELIRLAGDKQLHRGQVASHAGHSGWAPAHAWRALGQMGAAEAVQPLLDTLEYCLKIDDDAALEEIPVVLAMIGRPAVEPIRRCLLNARLGVFTRIGLANALQLLVERNPDSHDDCVKALHDALRKYRWNDHSLNAQLALALCELRAAETMPLIEEVHQHGAIDHDVYHGLDEARRIMGMESDESAGRHAESGVALHRSSRPLQ